MMDYKNTLLEKIVNTKKEEISSSKYQESLADLRAKIQGLPATRNFLKNFPDSKTSIIAEIKKASPSAGLIRPQFDPVEIAKIYLEEGAAAISVLTDPVFFQGHLSHLQAVRKVSEKPLLRKDFLIDPYQVYQARVYGADCILAIVAILDKSQLIDICGLAQELGMYSLLEVHDQKELQIALQVKQEKMLMGINNRDLKTLKIDLQTSERLRLLIPKNLKVISESGISKREEIDQLLKVGMDGFLIGETFLKAKDIRAKFREFLTDLSFLRKQESH